jgi:hypothetical protein
LNASRALAASPAAKASSTARTNPRNRLRRLVFITVRRSLLRNAFLADLVFAISALKLKVGFYSEAPAARQFSTAHEEAQRFSNLGFFFSTNAAMPVF